MKQRLDLESFEASIKIVKTILYSHSLSPYVYYSPEVISPLSLVAHSSSGSGGYSQSRKIMEFNEFFASDSEVIVLCTSIVSTAEVLSSIPAGSLQKPRLFVDVLSVKEYPRELLLQALPEQADLLCTHPMFGPESGRDGWDGLPLVYDRVRVRNHDLCDKYLGIFHQEGCRMLEMSCEEHDRMTAKTQFLAHTIGRIFDQMEIEPTPIDTNGFQKLLQVKDSSIKDSLDLYIGLYQHNKFAIKEMEKLELAFQAVKRMLLERIN